MEVLKYELKTKFKLAKGGEQEEASFLEITAPTNEVIKHVCVLDQELNKAFFNFQKNATITNVENDTTEIEITGKELLLALQGGSGDIKKCYTALEFILILTCLVDGQYKFTQHMFKKMDFNDTKSLLGEYLKFFLSSSLLN